jgi:hypothetical protein
VILQTWRVLCLKMKPTPNHQPLKCAAVRRGTIARMLPTHQGGLQANQFYASGPRSPVQWGLCLIWRPSKVWNSVMPTESNSRQAAGALPSLTAGSAAFCPSTNRTESMTISSFPPRAIRRFGTASVTVPRAVAPFGITTTFPTKTSSKASNSTRSFTSASAEEMPSGSIRFAGYHPIRPAARKRLVTSCSF